MPKDAVRDPRTDVLDTVRRVHIEPVFLYICSNKYMYNPYINPFKFLLSERDGDWLQQLRAQLMIPGDMIESDPFVVEGPGSNGSARLVAEGIRG